MREAIWRVIVNDGKVHYFDNEVEAALLAKDSVVAGFVVKTSPIPLPKSSRDFAAFMEREERDRI